MAVASFQDLCAGFCELVEVPLPELSFDDHGRLAFHVVVRGVAVNLVHCPRKSPDHIFVIVELGPADGGDGSTEELRALLEANFTLLEVYPPVFSVDPVTGLLVLQLVSPLFDITPNDVLDLINDGVDLVIERQAADESREWPAKEIPGQLMPDFA
jgi:hypothetical protein